VDTILTSSIFKERVVSRAAPVKRMCRRHPVTPIRRPAAEAKFPTRGNAREKMAEDIRKNGDAAAVLDGERVTAGIKTLREKNEGNPFDPAAGRE
jgi:hypothetical protein